LLIIRSLPIFRGCWLAALLVVPGPVCTDVALLLLLDVIETDELSWHSAKGDTVGGLARTWPPLLDMGPCVVPDIETEDLLLPVLPDA
jgi:hypothetical protein